MTRRSIWIHAAVHIASALLAVYWGVAIELMRLLGAPPTWWSRALVVGAGVLIWGAILPCFSRRRWITLIPLVGSAPLVAFFVPASMLMLREYELGDLQWSVAAFAARLATSALVLTSFVIAVTDLGRQAPKADARLKA
jgi:hypothetical protein